MHIRATYGTHSMHTYMHVCIRAVNVYARKCMYMHVSDLIEAVYRLDWSSMCPYSQQILTPCWGHSMHVYARNCTYFCQHFGANRCTYILSGTSICFPKTENFLRISQKICKYFRNSENISEFLKLFQKI